jgi:hypothetical protein
MRKGQIGARHVAWMRGAFDRMRMPAKSPKGKTDEVGRGVGLQQAEARAFIGRESNPCHA